MPVLRCLIDTMIFDAIALEPPVAAAVARLTDGRRLELLADTTSIAQVEAVPDPYHRRRLQRVRVLVVPPPEGPAHAARLAELVAAPGVGRDDARIAAAAAAQGVPLVTEDRPLRRAAAAGGLPVWGWEDGLRPRIAALAGEAALQAAPAPVSRRRRRPSRG